jgi:hypothetical protein
MRKERRCITVIVSISGASVCMSFCSDISLHWWFISGSLVVCSRFVDGSWGFLALLVTGLKCTVMQYGMSGASVLCELKLHLAKLFGGGCMVVLVIRWVCVAAVASMVQ